MDKLLQKSQFKLSVGNSMSFFFLNYYIYYSLPHCFLCHYFSRHPTGDPLCAWKYCASKVIVSWAMGSEEWETWKSDRIELEYAISGRIFTYLQLLPTASLYLGSLLLLAFIWAPTRPTQITHLWLWTALKSKTSIQIRDQKRGMCMTKQYFETSWAPMQLPTEPVFIEV